MKNKFEVDTDGRVSLRWSWFELYAEPPVQYRRRELHGDLYLRVGGLKLSTENQNWGFQLSLGQLHISVVAKRRPYGATERESWWFTGQHTQPNKEAA